MCLCMLPVYSFLSAFKQVKDNESKGDQEKLEAIASLRADIQEKELLSKVRLIRCLVF